MEALSERVLELYGFLQRHRALLDAHSVDFFLCDHWQRVIPSEWRCVVRREQLPPDEAFLHPRKYGNTGFPLPLYQFLVESSDLRLPGLSTVSELNGDPLTITSTVDIPKYSVSTLPEHNVSTDSFPEDPLPTVSPASPLPTGSTPEQPLPTDDVSMPDHTLPGVPLDDALDDDPLHTISPNHGNSNSTSNLLTSTMVNDLLSAFPKLANDSLGTDISSEVDKDGCAGVPHFPPGGENAGLDESRSDCKKKALVTDTLETFGMSQKKSHEVERFSKVIVEVMTRNGLTQILDVGSGKGYLSEHLALQYGYTVVGVDSQETNTHGACKRNKKVSKVWKKMCGSKNTSVQSCDKGQDEGVDKHSGQMCQTVGVGSAADIKVSYESKPIQSEAKQRGQLRRKKGDIPKQECEQLLGKKEEKEPCENDVCKLSHGTSTLSSTFFPITMELRLDTIGDLLAIAEEQSGGRFVPSEPFCLVGLHTCGDLGSTALRLFVQVPTAKALCIVGCCYHHITETVGQQGRIDDPGFPMSSVLGDISAGIGVKGRMLACQTLSKFMTTTSGSSLDRIYWRALLQVAIARKYPEMFNEGSNEIVVGRLRHPPRDFVSYARVSLPKVSVGIKDAITDSELVLIEEEFKTRKIHLEAYLKFRGVIAPCIESLITLDRLLYLQEQASTTAKLVKLFYPKISPRCFGILAHK